MNSRIDGKILKYTKNLLAQNRENQDKIKINRVIMSKLSQLLTISILLSLSAFIQTDNRGGYRRIKNDVFKQGEHIEYLVHYGPINAGVAYIDVDPKHYSLNNRVCYRIDVVGKTVGTVGILAKVQDTWRTYVDTAAFVPHRFYRNIAEGNYRRVERTDFNPPANQAKMTYVEYNVKDKDKKKRKGEEQVSIPDYVQDMVSGYYYMRTLDFDNLSEGTVIKIPGILEDELYDFNIRYVKKEEIKTKFGKIHAHKLVPVMPKNKLFDGESSIRFWVSDDKNRVPVRVEADMFIGKVVIEVKDYKNLRHKFNFVKK